VIIAQQELDGVRSHHEQRESAAAQEQQRADDHERHRVLLFVLVKPRRDERPDLPEDRRRGDEDADDQPHLHLYPECLGRRREDQ
jgi:hypothetical protein